MGYQPLPQKPRYDGPPQWGVTAREAADALTHAFGCQRNDATLVLMRAIEQEIAVARTTPQEVGCVGYEELS